MVRKFLHNGRKIMRKYNNDESGKEFTLKQWLINVENISNIHEAKYLDLIQNLRQ